MPQHSRETARARALRAAVVVTLGLAAGACGARTSVPERNGPQATGSSDTITTDTTTADTTAADTTATDTTATDTTATDTTTVDTTASSENEPLAPCDLSAPAATEACCDVTGGLWQPPNGPCHHSVPGPFVPPDLPA